MKKKIQIGTVFQSGYTVIEVLLVGAIFSILIGIASVNLLSFQHKSQLDATVNTFLTDLKEQQTKAMVGDTEGRAGNSPYGVHIDTTQYVLFHGASYSSIDATNFKIILPTTLQFTSNNYNVIFASGSGELAGGSSIGIKDTVNNAQKTILLNKLGVVSGINNF